MHETLIAHLFDAVSDLDEILSGRLEDHIRSMTGIQAESPVALAFPTDSLSLLYLSA